MRAWVRVLEVHKRALAATREDLERVMTLPRFELLAALSRENAQTLAALSRAMLVTPGNLSGLVGRAARDGLVERRADPDDRRAWRVHLTPKGQRAFQSAERRNAAKVGKVFAALSATEMATLVRLLDKLRAPRPLERMVTRPPRAPSRPAPERAAPLSRRRGSKKG